MVGPLLPISPLGDGEMTNRSVCYFDVLGVDNKPTVWGAGQHVMNPNKETYGKASSLKIGAFLGGTPILGPQGPKKGDPPNLPL